MMSDDELKALAEDIKLNGLQNPIVLNHDGTVLLDGRNRYEACELANADPVEIRLGPHYTETQLVDYIVSANIRRRHLNQGQLAMIALNLESFFAEEAKKRQLAGLKWSQDTVVSKTSERGRVSDHVAAAVGVSAPYVIVAKAVVRDAPDLAEKVKSGEISLGTADKKRKERVKDLPKPKKEKPAKTMITLTTSDGTGVEYPKPKGALTFNETKGEGISWAAWSWNPVTGCLHGCEYCYARAIATQMHSRAVASGEADYYPVGFTPLFHHERLSAPANTVIPAGHLTDANYKRVFVCSMADLYGQWVPDEWIEKVHAAMLESPQWQYITLTKFPNRYVGLKMPDGAWVGTSVDEQKRVRIAEQAFAKLPDGVVKWLSLEPLLEPLEFKDLSVFDWVVIGAQTETYQPTGVVPAFAPPFEWVARLVAQAREAGCRVHLKPNLLGTTGPKTPGMELPDEYPI